MKRFIYRGNTNFIVPEDVTSINVIVVGGGGGGGGEALVRMIMIKPEGVEVEGVEEHVEKN